MVAACDLDLAGAPPAVDAVLSGGEPAPGATATTVAVNVTGCPTETVPDEEEGGTVQGFPVPPLDLPHYHGPGGDGGRVAPHAQGGSGGDSSPRGEREVTGA